MKRPLSVSTIIIFVLFHHALLAQNRYWVAATSAPWSSNNWSTLSGGTPDGLGPPIVGQTAIFNSLGMGNCTVDLAVNIESIQLKLGYTSTLDINGNSFAINGVSSNINFEDGLVTDLTSSSSIVINSSPRVLFSGTTFDLPINVTTARFSLNGSTFNGQSIFNKTGVGNDFSNGGNLFNGDVLISNSSSSYLIQGNSFPDIFNANLTLNNNGTNIIYLAHNSLGNQFNGNIILNSTSGQGIRFGQGSNPNSSTLAAGKSITIGASLFTSGNLELRNFEQLGTSNQSISLGGSSIMYLESGTIFNGPVDFHSPRILSSATTFNNTTLLEKTGDNHDYSAGNNTFNASTQITNSGTGYFVFGNGNPDLFNGDLTVSNSGSSRCYIAYNSTGNFIGGNLTLNNIPNATDAHIYLCNSIGNTLTINGGTTVINNGSGLSNHIYLGNYGSINFNGLLDLRNIGMGSSSRIYLNSRTGSNNIYNENITLSSISGDGIYFGESGGIATLVANKTVEIGSGGFSSGQLRFQNFNQLGTTAQNISLTGTGYFYNYDSDWGGNVAFKAPQLISRGCNYQGTAYLEKTGAINNYSAGGNSIAGNTQIVNSGSGYFVMGNGTADVFNRNLEITNLGTSNIYIAYNSLGNQISADLNINQTASGSNSNCYLAYSSSSDLLVSGKTTVINNGTGTGNNIYLSLSGKIIFNDDLDLQNIGTGVSSAIYLNNNSTSLNSYNGNIKVSSTAGLGIRFGYNSGKCTLTPTHNISIGLAGFSSGQLFFRNFIQKGTTPQNLTLTGTAYFYNYDSEWNGTVSFIAPRMLTRGCIYQETAYLEKTGDLNDYSHGGNTITGNAQIVNSGSGYFVMGNGTADIFNSNLIVDNQGSSNLYIAHNGIGHQVRGELALNQTATSTDSYLYLAYSTTANLLVRGKTTAINSGSGNNNRIYLGYSGAVTFDREVDLQNIGTGTNASIYLNHSTTSSNLYNGNIRLVSTNGLGIRFGDGGGSGTLANSRIISIGTGGFSVGNLNFRNFSQLGITPQSISTTGLSYFYTRDSDWGGNVSFVAPRIYSSGTLFRANAYLEKTGANHDYSPGGNTIVGNAQIVNTGSANFVMGNGTADIFSNNLDVNNQGTSSIYIAYNGLGHQVLGDLNINQTASGTNSYTYIARGANSDMVVNGTTLAINNGSGINNRIYLSYSGDMTFNGPLNLQNIGTGANSAIYLNHTSTSANLYNENILVASTNGLGIRFGESTGTGILATNKTVRVGSLFSEGYLRFRNFNQIGTAAQSILLSQNATLFSHDSNWGGDINFISPQLLSQGSLYQGKVYFEKNGPGNSYSYGGNTFQQLFEIVNSSNGQFVMGNSLADIYNGDVLARNIGQDRIYLAHNSPGNQFNGKLYFYNQATDNTVNECMLNYGNNATSTFADSVFFINAGSGYNRFQVSYNGQATFNGPVVMQNFCSHTNGAIYCNRYSNSSTFNDNIIVESSAGLGIYFGLSDGNTTLSSGNNILIGPSGFSAGELYLRSFNQLGITPQNLTLTGVATLTHYNSQWYGPVNFVAPRHYLRGTLFNNSAYLEKNGANSDYSYGGNTFNGNTTFHASGIGQFTPCNNSSNDFNADITYRQSNTGSLYPAFNRPCTYAGDIYLDYIPSQQVLVASNTLGRVVMDGNQAQSINKLGLSQNPTIRRFEINKSANQVSLNVPVFISHELDLIQGNILSSSTNLLTMLDNSLVLTVSDFSFVDGPIEKIGNDAFVFPVGKDGVYRHIAISAPASTVASFRAEYFWEDPQSNYNRSLKDLSLNEISACEYWLLDRMATTSAVDVTLSWSPATSCGVGNLPDLQVARWNGSLWKDHGNGGVGPGTVTTAGPVANFSPFTLTQDTLLTFPVELVSFDALRLNAQQVQLDWATETEKNNAGFEVQRMLENENEFATIDWVVGMGTSFDRVNYNYVDENNFSGISFYRLRQVDIDGSESFSDIRAVDGFNETININLDIYPNPVKDVLNVHFGKLPLDAKYATLKVISLDGKIIHTTQVNAKSYQLIEIYEVQELLKGNYILYMQLDTGEDRALKFTKQ